MADEYTLRFPDGKQYGPIDRATLKDWQRQGRIPEAEEAAARAARIQSS